MYYREMANRTGPSPGPLRSRPPGRRPSGAVARVDPAGLEAFRPDAARPVRVRARTMPSDTHVEPHAHPWSQLTWSPSGVLRVTAGDATYIVPPSRALWIPPGLRHAVTVVETAELRTLYIAPEALDGLDAAPRVLDVPPLLRDLALELDAARTPPGSEREGWVMRLIVDELRRAPPIRVGIPLPSDRRLRALCDTVLAAPSARVDLAALAAQCGASVRTITRLFRRELDTTFGDWHAQVLLAQALPLAARGWPVSRIAGELGYASPSAFAAMVTRTVGMPPTRWFGTGGVARAAVDPAADRSPSP